MYRNRSLKGSGDRNARTHRFARFVYKCSGAVKIQARPLFLNMSGPMMSLTLEEIFPQEIAQLC